MDGHNWMTLSEHKWDESLAEPGLVLVTLKLNNTILRLYFAEIQPVKMKGGKRNYRVVNLGEKLIESKFSHKYCKCCYT